MLRELFSTENAPKTALGVGAVLAKLPRTLIGDTTPLPDPPLKGGGTIPAVVRGFLTAGPLYNSGDGRPPPTPPSPRGLPTTDREMVGFRRPTTWLLFVSQIFVLRTGLS